VDGNFANYLLIFAGNNLPDQALIFLVITIETGFQGYEEAL